MSRAPTPSPRSRQGGFTLVELMIALVIGLLLLAGVLQILLSNRTSFDAQRATAHLQENARLAEFVLDHAIAHAGYRTALDAAETTVFPGTSNASPNYPDGAYVTGTANADGPNDALRLRFQARGDVRDCLGGSVGTVQSNEITDFQFFVNDNDTLECTKYSSTGATTQPIVENVDRFKVRYGLDTDNTAGVDRYVSTLTGNEAREVRSVRFQLLLHSADNDPAVPQAVDQKYSFSDGSTFETTDRRARVLIDRTVAIRNPSP
ncbi:PilW family protein [Salinisphaera hydrothermalis]|uniref:Putative type 4 fimbrial biogenesis transmembrane protein, pilW n=1 Tax=Salinisphaera hydrothermalis (strain C41B8) TaxID=1304275 RepID=A0A084IJK4_SALHC|nr:PilW family protein [Salinisphaera hydrothermalis]KEZ76888.1 putative type 4 fimbrial biogenesis transmembrane protein, pilW [Salinisphaera hydrothermalis C41B8]